MIKGVNHQVIEVTETGNPFFERALLVLRPDCADAPKSLLQKEAQRLVQQADSYTAIRRNRTRYRRQRIAWLFSGSALGAAVSFLLMLLFR